eukprot:COSAG01_NODE_68325_length_264_cov_0.927273_1_plen_58_part_10
MVTGRNCPEGRVDEYGCAHIEADARHLWEFGFEFLRRSAQLLVAPACRIERRLAEEHP